VTLTANPDLSPARDALMQRGYAYADNIYPGAPSYVRDALMAAWLHGYACGGGSVLQGVQALMLGMAVPASSRTAN
jgi:hypothetical protein